MTAPMLPGFKTTKRGLPLLFDSENKPAAARLLSAGMAAHGISGYATSSEQVLDEINAMITANGKSTSGMSD